MMVIAASVEWLPSSNMGGVLLSLLCAGLSQSCYRDFPGDV